MNVEKEIRNYITEKETNGALLITGKWGCGKTYLLKNFIKNIEDNSNELYRRFFAISISLFGIDTLENLHKEIKKAVSQKRILDKIKQDSKKIALFSRAKKFTKAVAEVFQQYSDVVKGINALLSINPYDFFEVKKFYNGEDNGYEENDGKIELVLFFDDFERCTIDKVKLLGAINEYVENKQIKTIFIADEEYIKDEKYSEFKEKVVFRTIRLSSEYDNIIDTMIDSYKTGTREYREFLKEHNSVIKRVFTDSGSENLRTVKSFMIDLERVFNSWKESGVSMECARNVLYNYGAIFFEGKAGKFLQDNREGTGCKILEITELIKKYTLADDRYQLDTLWNWIVKGEWNEEAFIEELKRRFRKKEESSAEQKFLYSSIWDLEQNELEEGLQKSLEKAHNGQLCCQELQRLLKNASDIENAQLSIAKQIDYTKIKKGWLKREKDIKEGIVEEPQQHIIIMDSDLNKMRPEVQDIYKKMRWVNERRIFWENEKVLLDALKGRTDINTILFKRLYIISFTTELMESFFIAFCNAKNSQKKQLIELLSNDIQFGYNGISTPEDKEETQRNLLKLKNKIEELANQETELKKYVCTRSIDTISQKINKLQKLEQG